MVDFRAGYEAYGLSRKIEIVKGKEYSAKQTFKMALSHSSNDAARPNPVQLKRISKTKKPSSWSLKNPEAKRKKRIAQYKFYSVEGKVKSSFRNGFRWIKNKCSQIVHGF
ncbi:hypothetical protein IFM89_033425 [Coptis chinensis]|uniref:DUF3511 domain-containing protein n=1 Tax=Coptis chinensis TaxID=261450 RepID=A0A835HZH0_9MAGN|nr:hypothetical protein IFM89_033425 [Coptis chinensis]